MSVFEFLEVIAPHLTQRLDRDRINKAMSVAENYRPTCLPCPDKQELAVAYYTAYLLESQQENQLNPMGVIAEREGDLSRSYAPENSNAAKFYAKWKEFDEICVRAQGAIKVGLNYGNQG